MRLLNKVRLPIPVEKRPAFIRHVWVYALTIILWAVLHDLILISIEPRHFTEFHTKLYPFQNHLLLVLEYATVATFGPGMMFGIITFALTQLGRWRAPLSFSFAYKRFFILIFSIETLCLLAGHIDSSRYQPNLTHTFYPEQWYPDNSVGIAFTQTANITAYLSAAIGSAIFFLYLQWSRFKQPSRTHSALDSYS
ncbi:MULTISPECIES: hypothetical protein [unclassified Lentimonas]|uniref:hypothetical protein n=1 Tax=unclassified Lentimonas TaxID=2630993 RepID=UPI001328484E|nr:MULTISPECIES: hypothetical protein [unclassified Lentimonas]CAA6677437.1 Unannotated [Lentimonas sp. CC4]CAA6686407.1 Unannotated [Lentimonas sp. CC6]CAA7074683.1 Unannotated [Lentimonas sp. CC4]CAA7169306.1 Unannotated [Lentimonas sp. CC21]CAA7180300.1 Unannotated [Lentimonas sp. CC8]